MSSVLRNYFYSPIFKALLLALTAIIFYASFMLAPPPLEITRVVSYRTSYIIMALLILLIFAIWRQRSFYWSTASFALTLIFFSLIAIYKWQVPVYDGNLIGGLIPWSDAGNYFTCGNQLLIHGEIDIWCARRPIFPLFWGFIYGITGVNLTFSIFILVALNALGVHFAAREIRQSSHSLSAAIYILFSFIYYYTYAGAVLTENLGFAFGSLALACLLRGDRQNDKKISALGLFLVSLALNARAGAFFILPFLVLWFIYRYQGELSTRRLLMLGLTAIVLPFFLNTIFLKTLAQPGSVAFSNYADTFYGLASGNKSWLQIHIDHPDAPESEYAALALEKFKENPLMLVWGILGAYSDYFKPIGAFTYLTGSFSYSRTVLLWLAFGASLYIAWIRRKAGLFNLMLFSFFGIFASVGLLPPKDADVRAYAATIPVINFIFSAGMVTFLKIPIFLPDKDSGTPQHDAPLLIPFVTLLCMAVIAGPYLVISSLSAFDTAQSSASCEPGQHRIDMVSGKSSTVILGDFTETLSPFVRPEDFIHGINTGGLGWYPNLDTALLDLHGGNSITIGFNLFNGRAIYLISEVPVREGRISICALPTKDETLKAYSFYYYTPPPAENEAPISNDMLDSYNKNRQQVMLVRNINMSIMLLICLALVKDTLRPS